MFDTRWQNGALGGPAIPGHGSRDFILPNQLSCGVPNTAAAYSLNVTVVPHGTLGYLTVWPSGQTRPTISTLNSPDGRVKANAAIVPAGNNEAVSVYATDTTDVVLDIDGYFVPAASATLAFFPLTPCRVADTRWPTGSLGGPMLQGKTKRDFPVLASSCNIPNSAAGYSMNFTAVPRPKLGYLSVWPTGQSQPVVSTLNAATGVVTANAAIVPAGQGGAISTYVTDNTDLIIDIDGYFAPPPSGPNPLSLYALAPCRVWDTRHGGGGAFSGMLPVTLLTSPCNVPSAEAYVLNATVVPQGGHALGYLTLWPDTENQPVVSTLNAVDGAVTSNMAIVPTLNGSIDAYATNPTDLVLDIFSYFAPIGPLKIMNTSLPAGTVNYSYSTTLSASGGVAPYIWSVGSGHLPAGLNLDPNSGVISGTPTIANDYSFTVQVKDSQSVPATAVEPLSINVTSTPGLLSIVTTTLPSGTQNSSYGAMLASTGGVTPYAWSILSGSLPRGLSLNSSTGAITGTPSGGGLSTFTVQVTDSNTPHATASASLSITVSPAVALRFVTTSLPAGNVGVPYAATIIAVGGVYPYTWAIASGSLPAGFTLNAATGVITGNPIASGTSNFEVQVTDSETPSVAVVAPFSITINPGIVIITTTSLPNGVVGNAYSATLTATGGLPPYTWSISSGSLPTGLTLNSGTGVISGTPTVTGTSNFTVKVIDSEVPQVSATAPLSIIIKAGWTLTVLHNFAGSDGANPSAAMVLATDGNFYGTAYNQGPNGVNAGTVFKITPSGTLTTLYDFCQQSPHCKDGWHPLKLIQGRDGNFYGVTQYGNDIGDIYKLTPGGQESVLYTFCSILLCSFGDDPTSLMQASDGNFYGLVANGGGSTGSALSGNWLRTAGRSMLNYGFDGTIGIKPGSVSGAGPGRAALRRCSPWWHRSQRLHF